jgi:hypothetical protein
MKTRSFIVTMAKRDAVPYLDRLSTFN